MRHLKPSEIRYLGTLLTKNVRLARRAKAILLLNEGMSFRAIQRQLGCNPQFIVTWQQRYLRSGARGLHAKHWGRSSSVTRTLRAKVFRSALKLTPDGKRPGYRLIAKEVGLSHTTVRAIFKDRAETEVHYGELVDQWIDCFDDDVLDVVAIYMYRGMNVAVFTPRKTRSTAGFIRINPVQAERVLAKQRKAELPDNAKFPGALTLAGNPSVLRLRTRSSHRHALEQFFDKIDRLPTGVGCPLILISGQSRHQLNTLWEIALRRTFPVMSVLPSLHEWHDRVTTRLLILENDARFFLGPDADGLANRVRAAIRIRQHALHPVEWVFRRRRPRRDGGQVKHA